MISNGPTKNFYRTIASILAVVFVWYDISWGGTLTEDMAAVTQTKAGLMTPVDLVGSQGAAQSAVDAKNAIENYSTLDNEPRTLALESSGPSYTYYQSGRRESMTLTDPDAQGNIYYYYKDEDWKGQGYGRVQQTKRLTPDAYGALSHGYVYYTDANGRLAWTVYYSDDNWTTCIFVDTHYNDTYGRISEKNLATADAQGNIFYHYKNEDWQGQGYGRVDRSKLSVANSHGEISFKYTYNTDATGRLKTKTSYATSTFTTLLVTYTYYNDVNNRLYYKTLAAPDANGIIYYSYLNEDWQGQGYGKVVKTRLKTADNGCLSYYYSYYTDATGRIKYKKSYSDSNWAALISTLYYNNNASSNLYYFYEAATGNCFYYYNDAANRLAYKTLKTADAQGMIYYHYRNEDWQAQGYGRVDQSKLSVANSQGEMSFKYTYNTDAAGRLKTKTSYATASFATLLATYTYSNNETNCIATKVSYCYVKDVAGVDMRKTRQSLTYDPTGTIAVKEYNYTYFGEDTVNYPGNTFVATNAYITRNATTGKVATIIDYFYSSTESGHYTTSRQYRVNTDGTKGKLWKEVTEYIYLGTTAKTKTLLTYNTAGTIVIQKDEYTYDSDTKLTNWKKTTSYRSANGTRSKETEYVYFGTTAKTARIVTYGTDGVTLLKDESWTYYSVDAISFHKIIDNETNTVTEESYAPDGTNTVTITNTLVKTVSDYDIEGYITGYREYAVPTDILTAERTYYDHGKLKSEKLYDANGYVTSFKQYYSNGISIELDDAWEYYPDYSLKTHTSIFKSPPLGIMSIIRTVDAYEIDGSMTRTVTSTINQISSKTVSVFNAAGIMKSYTEYAMPSDLPALERTYYDDRTFKSEKIYNAEGDPAIYKEYDTDGETVIKDASWEYDPKSGMLVKYTEKKPAGGQYGSAQNITEWGDFYNGDQSRPGYEYEYIYDGLTTTFIRRIDFTYYANGNLHMKTVLRTPSDPKQIYEYDETTGHLIKYTERRVGDDSLIAVYDYDSDEDLVSMTTADGTVYFYEGGSSISPIRMIRPDSSSIEYFYDETGALKGYQEYKTNGDIDIYDAADNIIYSYVYQDANAGSLQADMSVTTASGDIVEYKDGVIVSVTLASDGTKLTGIELDAEGNLKNALISSAGGARSVVRDGVMLQMADPGGTFIRYRDGRRSTEFSVNTGIVGYSYKIINGADIYSTRVWTRNAICLYDGQGVPISFIKSDGERIEYGNGYIKNIMTSEGVTYTYDLINDGGTRAELIDTSADASIPVMISYDENKHITSVVDGFGTTINYLDGLSFNVSGSSGDASYKFTPDPLGNISQTVVDRDGIRRTYDQYGNLVSLGLTGDDSEISIGIQEGSDISFRLVNDSSILTAPNFSGDDSIVDGTVEKRDAQGNVIRTVVYQGGKVRSYKDASGNECTYDAEGNLTQLKKKTSGGDLVTYIYTSALVTTAVVPEEQIPVLDDDDLILIKYENYEGGKRVIYSETKSGNYRSYEYTENGIGVTEGVIHMVGGQKIEIKERLKIYNNDRYLISAEADDGSLFRCEYGPDNLLSRVTVTKEGVVVNEYIYDYDGEFVYVTSGDNVYEYLNGSLTGAYKYGDGYTYHYKYCNEAGRNGLLLDGIRNPDGLLIVDILCDVSGNIQSYAFIKDGMKYFVEQGRVTAMVKPDNTRIEYGIDGMAARIIYPDGSAAGCSYDTMTAISAGLDGALSDTTKIISGTAQIIQLVKNPSTSNTLLLHFDASENPASPVDSSTHNHPVTVYGDSGIDASNVKFGGSSYYFDGNSTFSLADSGDFRFSENSIPCTIDFWIYPTSDSDGSIFYKSDGSSSGEGFQLWRYGSNGLVMFQGVWGNSTGGIFNFGVGIAPKNTWTHIALTKGSDLMWRGYANGVGGGYQTQNKYTVSLSSPLVFGTHHPWPGFNVGDFYGYIDEFRVSNTVLWTEGFNPPQRAYEDPFKSSGTFTSNPIEINNAELKSVSWKEATPEGTDITIQTRTGNSLNPNDGTWSAWSSPVTDSSGSAITSQTAKYIQYKANLLTTDVSVTPELIDDGSGAVKIQYVIPLEDVEPADLNGVTEHIDYTMAGASPVLQLAHTPDPSVPLLLHFNGPNGATSSTDDSIAGHPVTFYGDAHLDISNTVLGISSLLLDGNGDYVTLPDSNDWYFTSYGNDVCVDGTVVSNGDYVASANAFDNNTSTYWESAGGGAGHWIKYDFGAGISKVIQKLRIFNSGATGGPGYNGIQGFALQGSNDDSAWTNVYQGTCPPSADWYEFTFTNETAYRYYRLYSTSSYHPDAILVKEVELLEANRDFTIDCWVNAADLPAVGAAKQICSQYLDGANFWSLAFNNDGAQRILFQNMTGGVQTINITRDNPMVTGAWYHLAVVRSGNIFRIFLNGEQLGSDVTDADEVSNFAAGLKIGALTAVQQNFNGRIDELRISKGVALWTSDFTPPQAESNGIYNNTGIFTSDPVEINSTGIGSISWDGIAPEGTSIAVQARTGDTLDPDDGTWTGWFDPSVDPAGPAATPYPSRYIQYKITLSTTNTAITPEVIGWDPVASEDLAYIKVSKSNGTFKYGPDGVNVSDPADTIAVDDFLSDVNFSEAFVDTKLRLDHFMTGVISYLDRQVRIDDILNFIMREDPELGADPSAGLGMTESSATIWSGEAAAEDTAKLSAGDPAALDYELITNGSQTDKRIIGYEKKNGEKAYYFYSENGKTVVEDIKDADGRTSYYIVSTYDAEGVIQSTEYLYDDPSKNKTITYENGFKHSVIQNDRAIITYDYVTGEDGRDYTILHDASDLENPIDKYYVDEKLIETMDQNQIKTAYEYGPEGRITRSVVSRSGKEMEVYTYSYDDVNGYTIITDMTGVKKAYDNDNHIVYVVKDGKTYAYYYSKGDTLVTNSDVDAIKDCISDLQGIAVTNGLLRGTDLSTEFGVIEDTYTYEPGTDFAIEELTRRTDEDGNVIIYNDGLIVRIERKDGSVLSDITYDGGNVSGFKITFPASSGGAVYTVLNGAVTGAVLPDGSATTYYPNGWVKSRKDASGIETVYIYEVPLTYTGSDRGATYYTHIDSASGALTLSLDNGANEGNFTSDIIEVNAVELRHIGWTAVVPAGSAVSFQIRTADEADAWSAWSAEITSPQDLAAISAGKYLQYKVIVRRGTASSSPSVDLSSIGIDILARHDESCDKDLSYKVTADGKVYIYDSAERLAKIIDGTTTYTYTKTGLVDSILEDGGKTTTFIYDAVDGMTLIETVIKDSGREVRYDKDNRLTRVIDEASGKQYDYFYNGDVVTVKTTFTRQQSSFEDFAGFDKDNISVTDYEGVTRILLDRTTPLDFGTGADGALLVKNGEYIVLSEGEYDYESITVEEGATLTISPWNGTTGGSLILRCQGQVSIEGTLIVSGCGYRGGAGGVDGQQGYSYTGAGGYSTSPNGGGGGGGGGRTYHVCEQTGGGGGGGGYRYTGCGGQGGTGGPGGAGGSIYGDDAVSDFNMGSGGGGGGGSDDSFGPPGGPGGNGGGKIRIMAPMISVAGSISANGTDGAGNAYHRSSGGGGSGGSIILSGEQVALIGNLTACGGYGGTDGYDGGDGSPGRIRVDYGVKEGDIFPGSSWINSPSIYYNQLTYESEGSLTSDAIAIDTMAGSDTTAYINANLDIPVLANVKIETRTGCSADTADAASWSGWEETTLDQFGYKINSDLNSYIQYRVKLSCQENDLTPSIYALNGFAVKLTFTDTAHFNKDSVTFAADAVMAQFALPGIPANASSRIESIKAGGAEVEEAGWGSLVQATAGCAAQDISAAYTMVDDSALSGDEPIVTKYAIDTAGAMRIEYIQKKDGSIEHYDADGKVRFVTDDKGALIMRYYYDAEGNPKDVRLINERAVLAHQISVAQNEILKKKIEDLQRLAQEMNAAHSNLDAQVAQAQAEIDAARAEIESVRYISYETQVQSMFGSKKMTVVVENPYYSQMIEKLDLAERKFHDNAALAYFSLANMQNVSKGRIEAAAMQALANIKRQRDVCMVQILRKELTTIIYDYYLEYLGRLPDTQELNTLIEDLARKSDVLQDTYTLDIPALKTDLESRQDRVSRVEEISDIFNAVKTAIESCLSSDAAKVDLINTLGLAGEKLIDLSASDWAAILAWLTYNKMNTMHFGQSAFLALKELIDEYYEAHSELANAGESDHERYVRIAVNAILIDILAGVINPLTKGDLVLSLFALSKAATVEGLDIRAYKLDWEDLVDRTAEYKSTGREKVIVHMNSNHYVVVTGIDAENNVTYYEPNMGEDGESITVSKEEFMKIWVGYSLSARAPPETSKLLASLEAQAIKGSNIFLIISVIMSVISFGLSFIDNEFCQILSRVLAITAVICAGIGILESLKDIFTSFAASLVQFKDIFVVSFKAIGDVFAGTLPNFAKQILPVVADFGKMALNTLISIPHTITISRGLEFMGVDPMVSRIITSFVSGGMTNFMSGHGIFNFGGAFTGLTIQATQELCNIFDIPQDIGNLLSLTAGSLVNAGWSGFTTGVEVGGSIIKGFDGALRSIGNAFSTTILPNFTSELAYISIQRLGQLLGVDPRISYLAGIGIRSSISSGLSNEWKPDVMWSSVQNGLLRGVTSVALEWGAEQLGLSPLIGSLTSAAIAGGIEALLMGQNPVQGVFDTYFRAGMGLLTLGGDGGNNPWLRTAYLSQVLDFSRIIQERGIVNALETYATGFLHQQTINEIWKQGGIADLLTKPNQIEITTNRKGETVKRVYTMDITSEADKLSSNYIDFSPTYDLLMGFREGNVITHCEFVIGPDGRPQLKNGEREIFNSDGSERIEYVEDFNLNKIDYIDKYGTRIGYYIPVAGTSSIVTDANGRVINGKFISLITDYSVSTKDNQVTDLNLKRDYIFSETQRASLLSAGYTEQDLVGFKEVVSIANDVLQYFVLPPDTAIFNINEAEGKAWLDSIEADGRAFWQGVDYLIGEHLSGDALPEITADSTFPLANINLHMSFPGASDTGAEYGLSMLDLIIGNLTNPMNEAGQALISPSRWNYNTNYSAGLIANSLATGYRFVYDGGVNTYGLNAQKQATFYYSFNTTESIVVGNSAGATSAVKSMTISGSPKSDNYFLFTPQFVSPEFLEQQMQLAGIPANKVTVVEITGDFVTTTGFENNKDSNGNIKWNYVKLQAGGNLSEWNVINNHGAAVNGIVDGISYNEIVINGVTRTNVSLTDALKELINKEGN